jgi:hypothetical protein
MDSDLEWKSRIRAALEAEEFVPEDDVVEELAGHAQAMYAAARGSGCTHEEANARVSREIEFWRLNVGALRRPSNRRRLCPHRFYPGWRRIFHTQAAGFCVDPGTHCSQS